jgi:hypothetical protein
VVGYIQALPRRSLVSKHHTVSRQAHEGNLIYDHEEKYGLPFVEFTELINAQQNYLDIPCTDFHTNRTKSVGSVYINEFTP